MEKCLMKFIYSLALFLFVNNFYFQCGKIKIKYNLLGHFFTPENKPAGLFSFVENGLKTFGYKVYSFVSCKMLGKKKQ